MHKSSVSKDIILETNLVSNEQVEMAFTRIFGIGPKKAIQVCDQSGLNDNIKVDYTKYQIDRIIRINNDKRRRDMVVGKVAAHYVCH